MAARPMQIRLGGWKCGHPADAATPVSRVRCVYTCGPASTESVPHRTNLVPGLLQPPTFLSGGFSLAIRATRSAPTEQDRG
jgi:hypothetical protein